MHRNYSPEAFIWGSVHPTDETILLLDNVDLSKETAVANNKAKQKDKEDYKEDESNKDESEEENEEEEFEEDESEEEESE